MTDAESRLLSAVSLCALLCGCATPDDRTTQLPFHVAIIPATVSVIVVPTEIADGDPTELQLEFDPERLSSELVDALSASFAKVTLLPTPEA